MGARYGLQQGKDFFIAYDLDESRRIRSASGGVTSALLGEILSSGAVDGVVASLPIRETKGKPHFQVKIFRSVDDLDQGRSSHYHPLNYEMVLKEMRESDESFAFVGVPCMLRGLKRLPAELQKKVKYRVGLVCSHNVSGAFSDCLAGQEGVPAGGPYQINLRDKVGIPDANNFNNLFDLNGRTIRKNRFITAFTDMWRNYFFAQECCLYCPDFFGVDADVSIKDAWGRLSQDPLGTSLVIVNSSAIKDYLNRLNEDERLFVEECDADEVFNSQPAAPIFKHEKIQDRLIWKNCIREELSKGCFSPGWQRRWFSRNSLEYWRLLVLLKLSNFFYFKFGGVPVQSLLLLFSPLERGRILLRACWQKIKTMASNFWKDKLFHLLRAMALFAGYKSKCPPARSGPLQVFITGGYGYGNVGDEAQLAANLQHWRKIAPDCRITVATPDPVYTERLHQNVQTIPAARKALFGRNGIEYFGSETLFKVFFPFFCVFFLFNTWLMRAGVRTLGLNHRQQAFLSELRESDVLFLSGGGYLTGMTLTRLWDNMLLMRLAAALRVPVILSGQTIGIFKGPVSRWLSRWGLKAARLIYLRDMDDSPAALQELGIAADKVEATFDDALFFAPSPVNEVASLLKEAGVDPDRPYLAVNAHYWGQSPEDSRGIMKDMAKVLDNVQTEHGLQVVFVPMHKDDELAMDEIRAGMKSPTFLPDHSYQPAMAVGLIQNAHACLTMKHHPIIFAMAARVPVLSMAFDDYYAHKNKGAMDIFSQGDFLVQTEHRELADRVSRKLSVLLEKRDSLAAEIEAAVDKLKPRGGEVIRRFVEGFDT